VRATVGDKAAPCPLDRVSRQFRVPAPGMPWASDFTYASTWPGFVSVAFVVEPKGSPDIDAFARRIVGGRVSRSARAGFVLDALEPALHERRPVGGRLVRHSDKGGQPRFNRSSQRLRAPTAAGRQAFRRAFSSRRPCAGGR
jgi:transposase InsO family protein